jgi:hypothetical protein
MANTSTPPETTSITTAPTESTINTTAQIESTTNTTALIESTTNTSAPIETTNNTTAPVETVVLVDVTTLGLQNFANYISAPNAVIKKPLLGVAYDGKTIEIP